MYIIDPAFREQFDIAHATPRYQQILAAIPATFVGTEERLVALVRALCQEIQGVFMQQNATLPPWRDVAAQLSKWRPRRSMDHPISAQDVSAGCTIPSHNLDLVRTVSAPTAEEQNAEHRLSHGKVGGLARTSAPVPLGPSASRVCKGAPQEAGAKLAAAVPAAAAANSRGSLYQRVAGPMQQLVTCSYTQSGLLLSGL